MHRRTRKHASNLYLVSGASGATRSARFVPHIAGMAQDYQDGIFAGTNDVIETIAGKPQLTVEEFASRNRAKFTV